MELPQANTLKYTYYPPLLCLCHVQVSFRVTRPQLMTNVTAISFTFMGLLKLRASMLDLRAPDVAVSATYLVLNICYLGEPLIPVPLLVAVLLRSSGRRRFRRILGL
jgi:hypothetical protein